MAAARTVAAGAAILAAVDVACEAAAILDLNGIFLWLQTLIAGAGLKGQVCKSLEQATLSPLWGTC